MDGSAQEDGSLPQAKEQKDDTAPSKRSLLGLLENNSKERLLYLQRICPLAIKNNIYCHHHF